jgi:hypothetical protein
LCPCRERGFADSKALGVFAGFEKAPYAGLA